MVRQSGKKKMRYQVKASRSLFFGNLTEKVMHKPPAVCLTKNGRVPSGYLLRFITETFKLYIF